jgi:KDO2-lipid IV(A) lauroyltransferase
VAKKKAYRFVLYLFCRMGAAIFFMLPRIPALSFAKVLGRIAYGIVARHREKTLENLRHAFGREKSEREIQSLGRQVFEHLAMTAAEVLQFPKLDRRKVERLVDAREAVRIYETLLAEGKGLISITAHIGNWELLAGIFGLLGFQGAVLARRIYYEPYNRWIVSLRRSLHVPTLYRDQSGKEILKLLARNEIVGLLPDQDIDSLKGVYVPFFGRPAYTPIAPVRLALASGAPIVPNFLIREQGGQYRIVLEEVIRPEVRTTREEAVREYTGQWMRSFENVIRQYPEQWAWMHHRWKTQPSEKTTEHWVLVHQ